MTLALSYQYVHKSSVAYFHFKQLSIIPVVSLLLTFNKYTASGVFFFSTFLCFKILSVGVNTSVHQDIWEETNKKRALESFFLYFIISSCLSIWWKIFFAAIQCLRFKKKEKHNTRQIRYTIYYEWALKITKNQQEDTFKHYKYT